jgi:hypothetical protein
MATLDTILTRDNLDQWGADEIVACDPRHNPRRRGTVLGLSTTRLYVEWFDTERRTWVAASSVHDWSGRTDPIPTRGYVMRAPETAVRAREDAQRQT